MSAQWNERPEAAGRLAIWLLTKMALHLGRRFMRVMLYPLTLYAFLRRGPERRDSRAFLTRALRRPASTWQVLRHLHAYAATILDRVFLLSDPNMRRFDIRVRGLDQLDAQIARGHGVLLLGAHIGSFEALRALTLQRPDLQLRVVMDLQVTHALNASLHALNPAVAANVIDAGVDPVVLALALQEAANQGALIGLLADRSRPGETIAQAEFFGAAAAFPVAPYLIASMLGLPVVLAFGIYRGGNRYDLHFETFAQNIKIPRDGRAKHLQTYAQRYAARLEHYTRLDPYNWFNLYDFWHRSAEQPAARRESAAVSVG